jgi:Cupin superfamily protein
MRALSPRLFGLACLGLAIGLIIPRAVERQASAVVSSFGWGVLVWSAAQWIPARVLRRKRRKGRLTVGNLNRQAWSTWETLEREVDRRGSQKQLELTMPTVDVQSHKDDIVEHLERTYGNDWRRRPLLLRGLWTKEELSDPNRRLSLDGLLREPMTIPYFTDATRPSALTPDAAAPISSIVANISQHGMPHKIGSQLLIQSYPELIREVAPADIVTALFGAYFDAAALLGSGPFRIFPSLTTVPLFVAWKRRTKTNEDKPTASSACDSSRSSQREEICIARNGKVQSDPYTALHCEPIGNVAVQLSGRKRWTLVDPSHWHLVRPHLSPDGRAFVASSYLNESMVPTYNVVTEAGDGLWVPTWTWHQVVYEVSDEIAIGASLFHFRFVDFVRNQPLFAFLILPALVLELVGYNTQ